LDPTPAVPGPIAGAGLPGLVATAAENGLNIRHNTRPGNVVTFREWSGDHSAHEGISTAVQKLTTAQPVYKRITSAASCLAHLTPDDFPASLRSDVDIVFSIFHYLKHYETYIDGSGIPPALRRQWIAALMRINDQMMIAKGRYDDIEDRAKD
jgi:hypothetical protein